MREPRPKARTLPDACATRRSSDAARTESKRHREITSRVASRCLLCPVLRADCRRTEAPAATSRSSGTTIPTTVAVRDSGTEAARVTIIASNRKRSARKFASSRKGKVSSSRLFVAKISKKEKMK